MGGLGLQGSSRGRNFCLTEGSSSSFKSSSSCSLESSGNTWKEGGNRDRSVMLLLTVPSERTAPAHPLPSYSGMGRARETDPPAPGRWGGCAPPGQAPFSWAEKDVHQGSRSFASRWSHKSAHNTKLWEFCDGQGSLACCRPWGRKELDTTERLNWTDSTNQLFKNLK